MKPIVIKVGGSLFDLPDLGQRLLSLLETLPQPAVIVPGGGATADVVRAFDRVHGLGEEAAHWLALRACTLNGHFLATVLPGLPVVAVVPAKERRVIVDLFALIHADEQSPDPWPHRWDVTSDSLAVRVAKIAGASELILLKSVDWDVSRGWTAAADEGIVDRFFGTAVQNTPGLRVRVINARTWRPALSTEL